MERLEPQWDNKKSYLKLRKKKKLTFEDFMPNMKTNMNHNLLTQITEKSKHMDYSKQTVKCIAKLLKT